MSNEQLTAMREWARINGRCWKAALRRAWETGDYAGFSGYQLLQQVRNSHGPSWLMKFRMPD